jgi:hypothetical protein
MCWYVTAPCHANPSWKHMFRLFLRAILICKRLVLAACPAGATRSSDVPAPSVAASMGGADTKGNMDSSNTSRGMSARD